jgi:ArsR family transcriptional regulator
MDDGRLVQVLKALAHQKRFRMVQEIAVAGELSCGQIAERFSLSQPTISHHLKILVDAGVLEVRHDAQHHFISVNQELLSEVAGVLPARLTEVPRRPKRERKVAGRALS